jgi:hypothetical protein
MFKLYAFIAGIKEAMHPTKRVTSNNTPSFCHKKV